MDAAARRVPLGEDRGVIEARSARVAVLRARRRCLGGDGPCRCAPAAPRCIWSDAGPRRLEHHPRSRPAGNACLARIGPHPRAGCGAGARLRAIPGLRLHALPGMRVGGLPAFPHTYHRPAPTHTASIRYGAANGAYSAVHAAGRRRRATGLFLRRRISPACRADPTVAGILQGPRRAAVKP